MIGNNIIKKSILDKEPNSFGKIGGIESSHIIEYLVSGKPKLVRGSSLAINAGIKVSSEQDLKKWLDSYILAIKSLDYILEWCPEQGDSEVIKKIWKGKNIFKEFKDLEPFFHYENGWQYSLNDKRVLVISPFKDTILKQAEKFDKIWTGTKLKSIQVVKSPYPSEICNFNSNVPYWINLENMKRQIDICDDFDFAIIGCGGYSLLILDYIKQLKIPCIHLGGSTQLIFGIRGKRWDLDENFSKSNWYGTDNWTRPLEHEIPKLSNLVENGCYW